jgi:hypothetical protein
MGRQLLSLGALLAVLLAGPAHAFCVENALAAGNVAQAILTPLRERPPRVYDDAVEAGKQSCCNPRNAECNPDRVPDAGVLFFRAHSARAGTRRLVCGATSDPRVAAAVYAPVRGFLRFEANPQFNAGRSLTLVNPPLLLRVLDADRRLVTTFPCT